MQITRASGVTAERSGDRIIVLDAAGRTLHTLNGVAALLWDALDALVGPDALVDHLAARFPDVDRPQLTADVMAFVEELVQADLAVVHDASG